MKTRTTPRLPLATKNFLAMTDKEQMLWNDLLLLKEDKASVTPVRSNSAVLENAIEGYKRIREAMKALDAAQEAHKRTIYAFLVDQNGYRPLTTPVGDASLVPFTREEMDKDYLREVAPEAFTTVPDRLQINVK